jgi:PA14 domain/Bacterial TSP3 repeat
MILSSIWFVSKSLVQRVAPVLAVVLGSSLALKAQNVIGPQWSWVNVNIDDTARIFLAGPVGGLGIAWNQCIGTAGLTKTGLLNSNGVATTVGFTCNASNVGSWLSPDVKALTGSAFNFSPFNSPMLAVISGLTPGKKYSLYLCSYVPNSGGSRNVFTTSNVTTNGSTQLVDNEGPNGRCDRWLRGVNYTKFENIEPDSTNCIKLTLTSGSNYQRAHLSAFQLIENIPAATNPFTIWMAGYNFAGIPGADLSLEGDPDRDLSTNAEEYLAGTNPTLAVRRAGVFMTETWGGIVSAGNDYPRGRISGDTIAQLFASPQFYQEPYSVGPRSLENLTFYGNYLCSRSRAYITPTVTGNYTFWLSARSSAELLLSTDLTRGKYAKKRIAMINPELGSLIGIGRGEPNQWDRFKDQQSAVMTLQAGQAYYLEVVHHDGGRKVDAHTNLAWARDGGLRDLIPASVISSYTKTSDDRDDDCLPDVWETLTGLNPADNGGIDMARQGERRDYDGDGLTNREEYLLGTNPTNSDTDNDGTSDGAEVNSLGTNALVSNAVTDTLLSTVGLAGYVASSTPWTMTSGGLVPNSFRSEATWNFTVSSAGFWLFRLNTELMGSTFGNEEVPIVLKVDGKIVTRTKVRYGSAKLGLLQALTPWLTAGSHQVTVMVDNMLARRTVRLVSLQLYNPANAIANLAVDNQVFSHPVTSRTSPAYLEGRARDLTSMTVNGAAVSEGCGDGHWFTNIALADQASAQIHNIHYETGADTYGIYTWEATNVMNAETLTIRQGDTLKLGAWTTNTALTATLAFSSGGSSTLTGANTLLRTFPNTGTYTVTATLSSGAIATLVVKVVGAPTFLAPTSSAPAYSAPIVDILDGGFRQFTASSVDTGVVFEIPADRVRMETARNLSAVALKVYPIAPAPFGIAARLYAGGPILAVQRINVIGVSDAGQNKVTSVVSGNRPGYKLLNSPLTVSNLPPGGRIEIEVATGPTILPNNTTLQVIYPNEIVNGWFNLQFYLLLTHSGGYCHTIRVYDRGGNQLEGRWGIM